MEVSRASGFSVFFSSLKLIQCVFLGRRGGGGERGLFHPSVTDVATLQQAAALKCHRQNWAWGGYGVGGEVGR